MIHFNKVTWYSKLAAVILFVLTFSVAFCLGQKYGSLTAQPYPVYYVIKPTTPSTPAPEIKLNVKAAVNQTVKALGVTITPTEVTEDSRCPIDVNCIWAGTVKVKATIVSAMGSSPMTLELGKPVTTEAEKITLTEVRPEAVAGEKPTPSQYSFTFLVERR
jgi:hypothetical protein